MLLPVSLHSLSFLSTREETSNLVHLCEVGGGRHLVTDQNSSHNLTHHHATSFLAELVVRAWVPKRRIGAELAGHDLRRRQLS